MVLDIYYSVTVAFAFVILFIVSRNLSLFIMTSDGESHSEYVTFVNSIGLFLLVDIAWGPVHAFLVNTCVFVYSVIYNIAMILTVWMCCRYVSKYLQLRNKKGKILNVFGVGLFVVHIVMVIINFFYPILFWIDETGNYQTGIVRNIGMLVTFAVFMCIAISALYDTILSKGQSRQKFSAIFLFASIITFALFFQSMFPAFPAYSLGLVTSTIVIYVQIHVAMQSDRLDENMKLKKMVETTNVGTWELITPEGAKPRLVADSKMKEIMGLPADTKISEEEACEMILTRIHKEDFDLFMEYDTHLKEGKRAECTYRWNHPVLGERYNRCGGALISNSDGVIVTCGYHYDVTDQVKTEKELELNITENKMKTRFLHNMSHEIRTPLNAMFGFSQLLGMPDGSWTEEEKDKYNKIIYTNFFILDMLINDILDNADIQHGNYRMKYTKFLVNLACKNALISVEFRHTDRVKLNFSSDVDDGYMMESDLRRVQQILINFLTNACKHTEDGEIHLHVSDKEHPGMITFSVTDTGIGVPLEKADEIFGRYNKLDKNTEGSGLGLNICDVISTKLGGRVYLDTSYTGGARFVLELPVKK